jgi:hypothetical protein
MTFDEFKLQFDEYRADADRESRELKDSYLALDRLFSRYRTFDPKEREMANEVVSGWVLSGDESLRFDALALIDEFHISEACAVLPELEARLAHSRAPGAPYELKKVRRLLEELRC